MAVVTGALGGIGQSIVSHLLRHGWRVAVTDFQIDREAAQYLDDHRASGAVTGVYDFDIGDAVRVQTMFDAIVDDAGQPPQLLVNNAAIQTWSPLLELSAADWERVIRTNLTGTFLMTQCFARHLGSKTGGSIVNLGSGCGRLAFPNLVDYAASKGGIEMLTKTAALELGPLGIRVNCVAPGAIETERTRQETDGYAERWSALTPLGRIGRPEDIAEAVLFLASDQSRFISGQTLGVDGALFSRAIWPADY